MANGEDDEDLDDETEEESDEEDTPEKREKRLQKEVIIATKTLLSLIDSSVYFLGKTIR